jgi:hypothetical protein
MRTQPCLVLTPSAWLGNARARPRKRKRRRWRSWPGRVDSCRPRARKRRRPPAEPRRGRASPQARRRRGGSDEAIKFNSQSLRPPCTRGQARGGTLANCASRGHGWSRGAEGYTHGWGDRPSVRKSGPSNESHRRAGLTCVHQRHGQSASAEAISATFCQPGHCHVDICEPGGTC